MGDACQGSFSPSLCYPGPTAENVLCKTSCVTRTRGSIPPPVVSLASPVLGLLVLRGSGMGPTGGDSALELPRGRGCWALAFALEKRKAPS